VWIDIFPLDLTGGPPALRIAVDEYRL